MLKAGNATALDVQKQEAILEQSRVDLATAHSDLANAERALQRFLNLPTRPARVEGELGYQRFALPEFEASYTLALQRRPDYLSQKKSEVIAHHQREAARNAYYPTLSATGSYGFQGNEPNDVDESWYVGIGASATIWDSHRRKGEVMKAESTVAQALNRTEDLEASIRDELRGLLDMIALRAQSVQVARLNYDIAEANVKLEQDKKDAGTGKPLDLQNAEVSRAQAEYARLQAYYNHMISVAAWFHAIGDAAGVLTLPAPEVDKSKEK
jgi:outer membrane protein